ncbi:MAG: hypothetical protein AAFP02_15105, partial [Bacteroidota bacterium]
MNELLSKPVAFGVLLPVSLLACDISPSVYPRIPCLFAEVLVKETDIPAVQRAFGDDSSTGKKICDAVSILLSDGDDGSEEPIAIEAPTSVDLP